MAVTLHSISWNKGIVSWRFEEFQCRIFYRGPLQRLLYSGIIIFNDLTIREQNTNSEKTNITTLQLCTTSRHAMSLDVVWLCTTFTTLRKCSRTLKASAISASSPQRCELREAKIWKITFAKKTKSKKQKDPAVWTSSVFLVRTQVGFTGLFIPSISSSRMVYLMEMQKSWGFFCEHCLWNLLKHHLPTCAGKVLLRFHRKPNLAPRNPLWCSPATAVRANHPVCFGINVSDHAFSPTLTKVLHYSKF